MDGKKVEELKNEISNILNGTIEESKIKIDDHIKSVITPLEEKIQNVFNTLERTSNLNSQISIVVDHIHE
ncbi:hypothetical protein ES703_80146 [subsurface metagenome]